MHSLKRILYTLTLLFAFALAHAQSDLKAHLEFEEAEKAFSEENYEAALKHLNETEKLLGQWTPVASYLKIESLYALTDMGMFSAPTMQPLYEEVTRYMAHMNKLKSDDIPMEKYKVVYGIEKTLKALKLDERQGAEYIRAKKEHEVKNYDVVLSLWENLAQKGNSWAMRNLGLIYQIREQNEKAKEWYQKAINNGNADAALRLAELDKDNEKKWNEKAMQMGHPDAFYILGWYAKNKDNNPTKAMEYYEQAAGAGSASGLVGVAVAYSNNKEYEKTLSYLRKAELKGSLRAIYILGLIYFNGIGAPENPQMGMEYCIKAADRGLTNAMEALGEIYKDGKYGFPEGYEKAAYWYQRMIDADEKLGYEKLGDLYRYKQPQKALESYGKAMEAGYHRAMYAIASIYFQGENGITKDYAKAVKYYELYYDKEKKNESYIDNLIEMYNRGGNGIEKDKEKAKYWKEIRKN